MTHLPPHRVFYPLTAMLVALLATPALAQPPAEEFQMIHAGPGLSLHKEMFILPATLSSEYCGSKIEAVFQLSTKHRLFNTRFFVAYTQISFWQAYDRHNSAPFRETNYNPELFYRTKRHPFWSGFVGVDIGFEHESNGQIPPLSRSWNMLYAGPHFFQDDLLVYLKFRYRIPEDPKESPGDAVGDDNPDITDYYGYSDVHIYHELRANHSVHLMVRGNLHTRNGAVSLTYTFPIPGSKTSRISFRFFHGYGECLADYDMLLTRLGLGIALH